MENILIRLSNTEVVSYVGITALVSPMVLVVTLIIYFVKTLEKNLIYKLFRFPKEIKEYKSIKSILKVLGFTIIHLYIFAIIVFMMVLYYLILYGIFLPRLYGIESVV